MPIFGNCVVTNQLLFYYITDMTNFHKFYHVAYLFSCLILEIHYLGSTNTHILEYVAHS